MPRFVRTAAALEHAVAELAAADEIALDTEFHVERHYFPQLMLIQLRGDAGDPVLVDPLAGLDLRPLAALLGERPVIVHGGASDVQILGDALGCAVRVVFDTQIAAGCLGLGFPVRLQELASTCLGRHMPKGETLSDWSVRPLTEHQLSYAADDVMVLAPLKAALEARMDGMQAALAAAFSAEMVQLAVTPEDDAEAWRAVGGAQVLDGAERGVLRELARWRQREARARDVPRHSVVSDGVLLDLARRAPLGMDALRANRRMPSNVVKREGPALLGCISGAVGQSPPPPLYARPRAWIDLARAAGRIREVQTGVAAELLLPDRVIAALAEGSPVPDWRRDALGTAFFDFLVGEGSITMPASLRGFTNS